MIARTGSGADPHKEILLFFGKSPVSTSSETYIKAAVEVVGKHPFLSSVLCGAGNLCKVVCVRLGFWAVRRPKEIWGITREVPTNPCIRTYVHVKMGAIGSDEISSYMKVVSCVVALRKYSISTNVS